MALRKMPMLGTSVVPNRCTLSLKWSKRKTDFFGSNVYQGSAVLADDSSIYNDNGFDGLIGKGDDIVLNWDTFSFAAEQAGLSRLLGAIHTSTGDLILKLLAIVLC